MKVGLISLGCPKNLVDSEVMLGHLLAAGHEITPDERAADAIIVNTCCFIEPARAEAARAVEGALALKRAGSCRLVIIAGCWPQREGARLLEQFPDADAVIGVNDVPRIAVILEQRSAPAGEARSRRPALHLAPPDYLYTHDAPRLLATPPWTAYAKIAEGCDHRCSFCVIPRLRGPLRSRALASVVAEVEGLARRGVKEINLVAQDTTAYGRDLYGRPRLGELLRRLAAVEGVRWLRLMYCFPTEIDEDLIGLLRDEPKLCKYVDLPVQHSERELLRAMRRPGSGARYLELMGRLRAQVPGIALRTSIVVGFPGETPRQFEALLAFMAAARFDRAGAFVYSREEGTPAARLGQPTPPDEAQRRYRRVMELQQGISLELNRGWIGKDLEVLVEARAPRPFAWVGRSPRDAPEIDGLVYLRGGKGVGPGDFVRARITAAREYDLEGEIIADQPAPQP
ncbi:MAG TPA: 30S ribosomal protein S12 methylthiotransferase RimO [Armatimonadota bacterium]|nr:30S ribosomal protein S12 methylthiotransferase RimO [Armatimonadota bacterium]